MESESKAMTKHREVTGRARPRGLAFAVLLAAALLGMVCSEPVAMAARASAAKTTKAAIERTCQRVADVLSDGPDPEADPVGYALAQVRPLREIKTPDLKLKDAIDRLASAFEAVYRTNDEKGTEAAVQRAGKKVDAICPGAF